MVTLLAKDDYPVVSFHVPHIWFGLYFGHALRTRSLKHKLSFLEGEATVGAVATS